MAHTVKELIKKLSQLDPEEIFVGQIYTAESFTMEIGEDYAEVTPTQEIMKRIHDRYWADAMTTETWGWLADLVVEETEKVNA
jgi:hypothetical protein